MRILTVANMKGGSAKTTTAAFLAHALARGGRRVLAVDADPAGSLLRWGDAGGWAIPVIGMPTRKIHVDLPNVADRYDVAVIDTPPLDDQAGIVYSALRAASDVVVPVGATTMELDRISPIFAATDEVEALRSGPASVCVLLTRTVANASSVTVARQVIADDLGRRVLRTVVPRLERYALAFGSPVELIPGDPYLLAAEEIVGQVLPTQPAGAHS
jgi:chromosome partitioning protein